MADARVRTATGPVWVFDPQAIANENSTWWRNPLSYVTDEVHAALSAEHFAAGSRDPGARTDADFDPAAKTCSQACCSQRRSTGGGSRPSTPG